MKLSQFLPVVLLAALTGCGAADKSAPSGETSAPSGEASAPPAPQKTVVGAILMQQDQFFRLNESGMRAAAAELGADLLVQNAGGALDREVNLVETFVTQGVGAIIVSPLSSEASIPALQRASEKGVRVVTYNNALAAPFPAHAVGSDQRELGASSGAAARAWIESHGGKARVALVGFASQLPEQGGARVAGFKSALEGMPGVEIIAEQDAWEAPQAANVVGELLVKKPDVIWAANEGGTVGAVTAVRGAGLAGKVVVFGTDVSAQILDFLEAEDGVLQAVTGQDAVGMGRAAVTAAVKAARGEALESASATVPGTLLSRDKPEAIAAMRATLAAP